MADSSRGGCDQAFPEGGLMEAVLDLQALAFEFVFPGGNRFDVNHLVVKAAGAGEARFKGGAQYALGFIQQLFGEIHGQVLEKLFRANAGPACEKALGMIGTQVEIVCQIPEFRLLMGVLCNPVNGLFDTLIVGWHDPPLHVALNSRLTRQHGITTRLLR
ncbi:hypothetical protein BOW51_11025 [Solemya velesiana gill symbiont]|uniref:Uncharacterized protein n=1 Tax=Solemya velesiana gill symbiont TaxID=1918948 RepID=A0A1T2KS11_9GAMM|nr:hypothetical protein BOW51_11025 [Solemya velesiana gill symbiont]